jgi:hypothetical protein
MMFLCSLLPPSINRPCHSSSSTSHRRLERRWSEGLMVRDTATKLQRDIRILFHNVVADDFHLSLRCQSSKSISSCKERRKALLHPWRATQKTQGIWPCTTESKPRVHSSAQPSMNSHSVPTSVTAETLLRRRSNERMSSDRYKRVLRLRILTSGEKMDEAVKEASVTTSQHQQPQQHPPST